MDKFSEQIAKIISVIFHPLLMPTIGLLMIFKSGTYISFISPEGKLVIFYIVFAGTFIMPLCFIPFFYYLNIINNVEMDNPNQRIIPLAVTSLLYLSTFYILHKYPIPFINKYIFAALTCVVLNTLISPFWKISSHLIGVGGLTGLIICLILRLGSDSLGFLFFSILISGIIGFARLQLNKHTPAQVYLGFILGFVVTCGLLFK